MICPHCSKWVDPHNESCVYCGYRFDPQERAYYLSKNYEKGHTQYRVISKQNNALNKSNNNAAENSAALAKDHTNLVLTIVIPSVVVIVILVLVIAFCIGNNNTSVSSRLESDSLLSEANSEPITETETAAFISFEDSNIGKLLLSHKWSNVTTLIDTYGEVIEYCEFSTDGSMKNITEYMEGEPTSIIGNVVDYTDDYAIFQVNEDGETVEYTFEVSSNDTQILISEEDTGYHCIWMDADDVESQKDPENIFHILRNTSWYSPTMTTVDSEAYIAFDYPDDGITISGIFYDGSEKSDIYGYCINENTFYVTYGHFSSIVELCDDTTAYAYTYTDSGYKQLVEENWTRQK